MGTRSHNPSKSPFQGFLPFFWLAIAFLGGILLADLAGIPTWLWAVCLGICLLVWTLSHTLPKSLSLTHLLRKWTSADRRLPGAALAAVFLLGGLRYAAAHPGITPKAAAYYNDRGNVQITGLIVDPPDDRDQSTNITVKVESLLPLDIITPLVDPEQINGKVLVQVSPGTDYAYGDRVLLSGELQTPYESADFSYEDYLARKRILSLMQYARVERIESNEGSPIRAFLFRLREKGYETLTVLFPSPESDLLAGILLGRDQGLSTELQEAFRKTGTTHIIAISGFNIAILAGLFSSIFTRWMGRRWGTLTSIMAITGYTILVGADAAVVRAAIMGGLGVFGGMFGRRQNGLNSLGFAALFMMLADPNIPWDVGFQLSIAATLGLVLYAQPLEIRLLTFAERWLSEEQAQKLAGPISEFFLFTMAAQVMTLPVIAYHFSGISWLALIANPLILPVQSLVMILGGLAMLTGLFLPGLGQLVATLALPFVRYTIRMVTWLGNWPGGDIVLPSFSSLWLVCAYALLFLCTLLPKERLKLLLRKLLSPQLGLLVLTGLVIFTWNRVLSLPDDRLHLSLLDAEGTILIQTPDGDEILIGAGSSPSSLNQTLGEELSPGDHTLEVVIVGSPARDDLNALTGSLSRVTPNLVLWGIDPEVNQTAKTTYAALLEQETEIRPLTSGQSLTLGRNAHLEVLWVGEKGAVLWLEWQDFSALLPTGKVEENWLDVPYAPDVLLLPDGFAAEDLPLSLVNCWSPEVILLPLAETDLTLGGPHDLLALLTDYPVVSTVDFGEIHLATDGEKLWVSGKN